MRFTIRRMMLAVAMVAGLLALPRLHWGGADHSRFDIGDQVVVVLSDALYVAGYTDQDQQVTIRPGTRAVVVHDDWDDSDRSRSGSRPVEARLLQGKDKGVVVHVRRHELRGL